MNYKSTDQTGKKRKYQNNTQTKEHRKLVVVSIILVYHLHFPSLTKVSQTLRNGPLAHNVPGGRKKRSQLRLIGAVMLFLPGGGREAKDCVKDGKLSDTGGRGELGRQS